MRNFMEKHQIIVFCVFNLALLVIIAGLNVTYFPASFNYALMLMQWAPALAAIIVLGIINGKNGIRELFSRLSIKESSLKWSIVAMITPIICVMITYILFVIIEYKEFIPFKFTRSVGNYLICFLATIFGSIGEEIGWRGFMLPKLNKKNSLFVSSIIIGLFWGIWHMRFQMGLLTFGMYIVVVIFFSILSAWLCNKTNGNIFAAIILHTSINMSNLIFLEQILSDIADIQTGIQKDNQFLYLKLFGIMAIVFAVPCLFVIKKMLGKKTIKQIK